jgi:hypothetical protein
VDRNPFISKRPESAEVTETADPTATECDDQAWFCRERIRPLQSASSHFEIAEIGERSALTISTRSTPDEWEATAPSKKHARRK